MVWLVLLAVFMATRGGSTSAELEVTRGGGEGNAYRWMVVADPASGRAAYAMVREGNVGAGFRSYFRSGCFASATAAKARAELLLFMPLKKYVHEPFDAPAAECGGKIAKAMLDKFYPGHAG